MGKCKRSLSNARLELLNNSTKETTHRVERMANTKMCFPCALRAGGWREITGRLMESGGVKDKSNLTSK
jgi:hypothetical protein